MATSFVPFHVSAATTDPTTASVTVALAFGNSFILTCVGEQQRRCVVKGAHGDVIRSMAFNPEGRWFATCGDDKQVKVWDCTALLSASAPPSCVWESSTHKKPSQVLWAPSSSTTTASANTAATLPSDDSLDRLLVADKFGSVYPANHLNDDDDDDDDNNNDKGTNDNDGQPFKVPRHLVLGHYSTIVKLHHISNNKNNSSYLVSCDRDGKIRVSHFPQCHNIQSFCLGHDAFVNATASIEWQGLSSSTSSSSTSLISGGGDGRLILWDILTGVSTQILSIASVVNNDLFVAGHPPSPVVTSIVVVNSTTGIPLLCVALESYRGLLVFQLESPSSCIFRSTIEFQHPITSITSLKQDSAHVCVTLDDAPWVRVISLDAQHVDNNVTISHTFAGDAEASLQRSLPDDAQSVSPQERTRIRGVTALWANLRKFISADTRAATANVSVSDGFSEDGIHRQPKKPRANE